MMHDVQNTEDRSGYPEFAPPKTDLTQSRIDRILWSRERALSRENKHDVPARALSRSSSKIPVRRDFGHWFCQQRKNNFCRDTPGNSSLARHISIPTRDIPLLVKYVA